MATKYILNSGGVKNNQELARKFFAEIVKELGNEPKLLICYFAQPREDWDKKFIEDKKIIPKLLSENINPNLSLAFPATFEQQIKESDVIYVKGGEDYLLRYWFDKFDIPKIFDGKVVAGSSAGSDIFSKYFWTCDWRQNVEGLGILPIKFLPHYKSSYGVEDSRGPIDWDKALEELKNYKEDLPIYALKEGEFVVINK